MTRPTDLDPEQYVLGALLLDTRRLPDVAGVLSAEHYTNRHHAAIYRAIIELHDNGKPVDVVTVSDRLERTGLLTDVGGLAYVGALANKIPNTANVLSYATLITDRAMDRALRIAGGQIAQLVDEDAEPAEKIDRASEILAGLSRATEAGAITPISEILGSTIDEIEKHFERQGQISGDSTGFEKLDDRWDGLNPGDLIIIAGRPSMGKTALAMNVAAHTSRLRPASIFELEMPDRQLVKRMLSGAGNLPYKKLKRGDLKEFDWPKLTAALTDIGSRKLFIDDRAGQTFSRIRTQARKIKRQQRDIGLVVVDYLQIMDDEIRKGETRALAVQRITSGMKALAKELECAVILVSQLNRGNESRKSKKPVLSDLRDSGSIEQDADIVAFVHREDMYREDGDELDGLCEVITAKNRNGEVGTDILEWRGEFQLFVDTDRVPKPKTYTKKRGIDV